MQILLSLCLMAVTATASAAQSGSVAHQQTLEQTNGKFLRELTHQVERAGFRNATIIPEVFLVRVEDERGGAIMLLVNSNTLQAMVLEGASNALTTVTPKEFEMPKLR